MSRSCSLIFACWLAGCGAEAAPKAAPAPVTGVVPAAPEVAAVKAAVVDPPEVAAPEVAAVPEGKVGVAACDEYLDAYQGCVAGLREEDRASHLKVIEQQRAAWKVARADAKLGETLADTCAASRAASKVALPDCKGW